MTGSSAFFEKTLLKCIGIKQKQYHEQLQSSQLDESDERTIFFEFCVEATASHHATSYSTRGSVSDAGKASETLHQTYTDFSAFSFLIYSRCPESDSTCP